jgi:hypothetical protein
MAGEDQRIDGLAAETDRLGHELEQERRRSRALRIEVSALRTGLSGVKADLERVGASRAWRWGHRAARAAARVRGRRPRTEGALASALEQVSALERIVGRPSGARRRAPDGLLSFAIKMSAPSWEAAPRWGDLHFAEAIRRELERRGHRSTVLAFPEWDDPAVLELDVALVLRGVRRHVPHPAQFNVLWSISHPEDLTPAECDGYDLVCVASRSFAERLHEQTATPVMVLEQATDPAVFHPDPREAYRHALVFVGNTRNVRRRLIGDLLPTKHDLAIYGGGWKGVVDPRHVAAEHVPNDALRHVYSSAGVVLNDHWDDMRAHGFISNRLYDAVACGALVVSDHVDGVEERFGGAVVTYETRAELHELIEHFLHAMDERAARAEAGRARVLAAHTFGHRVDELLRAIGDGLGAVGGPGRD